MTVADDGQGFTDPERAVQRGVRLDEQVAGQGIGLSVVVDIVHAYGGQIEISRSTDGGALVEIKF